MRSENAMSPGSFRHADGGRVTSLRNAATVDGQLVDVHITGDRVAAVAAAGDGPVGERDLDLSGYLLLEAPAEPHTHLDKALSFDEIRPPLGDLRTAIASWEEYNPRLTVDGIADRARRVALHMLSNGTTAIRSHVNLLPGDAPLRGVQALVRVRAELAAVMDIQLAVLAPYAVDDAAIHAALDLGVDFVGGHPHNTPEPTANLRRLLRIAENRGIGVDMHTDEQLDPEMLTLEQLTHLVRDRPPTRSVTASHCASLGMTRPEVRARVTAAVAAAGIGVVALPITNLYLQGRDHPVATPRGITAVRALLDAGVPVAGGADNVRDPFNPLGRADAFETAMLLVTAAHLTPREAYRAVSTGAREVMGLPAAGPVPGAYADLLAIRASGLEDAIATAPTDRFVLRRGRLVAASRSERSTVTRPPD
ncbi:amidohydrolase family protein [Nocardia sp. NPDC019395]|uniref:amidohydrolase family protein n=1 Tax=Nocardia sp. NPDC019395 TaxID=3154686 RepID=UPI0033FFC7FA